MFLSHHVIQKETLIVRKEHDDEIDPFPSKTKTAWTSTLSYAVARAGHNDDFVGLACSCCASIIVVRCWGAAMRKQRCFILPVWKSKCILQDSFFCWMAVLDWVLSLQLTATTSCNDAWRHKSHKSCFGVEASSTAGGALLLESWKGLSLFFLKRIRFEWCSFLGSCFSRPQTCVGLEMTRFMEEHERAHEQDEWLYYYLWYVVAERDGQALCSSRQHDV